MIWSGLIAIALAATGPVAPAQTAWPTTSAFDIWRMEDACILDGYWPIAGRSDVQLSIVHGSNQPIFLISSDDWTSAAGEEFELTLETDRGVYSAPAVGLNPSALRSGFSVVAHDAFLDDFAGSKRLTVFKGETVIADFGLAGTGQGIADLRACQRRVARDNAIQAEREARVDYIARDPFAPSASDAPSVQPVRPPIITDVTWARAPMPEYPSTARERDITGAAVLACTVQANGSVTGCTIVSETPSGVGFGRAAVAAARSARLSPSTVGSVAGGGIVQFTVSFDNP